MKKESFKEYMREQFCKQHQGFIRRFITESEWITDLSPDEWIDYAEAWSANRVINELTKEG